MLFFDESIPVKFLGAFDLTREAGWIYTKERNSYYTLSIRINGNTDFYIGNEIINANIGDILMIPPNLNYSQHTDGERILAIHFNCLKYLNAETIVKQSVKDWETICNIFTEIYTIYANKPKGWYYKASSLLYELLFSLYNETEETQRHIDDNIDIGAEYLERHYTDHSITVAKLADISGYSEAYFRRLFFKRFGVTPSSRIDYLRIERAKRLLEAGEHNMSEIAEHIGISDPKYFSTWFKKHTGISPRDYLNHLVG